MRKLEKQIKAKNYGKKTHCKMMRLAFVYLTFVFGKHRVSIRERNVFMLLEYNLHNKQDLIMFFPYGICHYYGNLAACQFGAVM